MKIRRFRLPLCMFVIAAAMSLATSAYAQAVGADDYDQPEEQSAPGEAGTAPPTSVDDQQPQVHPGDDTQAPAPAPRQDLPEGTSTAVVHISHGTDDDIDLTDRSVILEAVRAPGPLQPDGHEQVVSSWDSFTDENGVAHFDGLPDNLAQQRLSLRASTSFSGVSFDSALIDPTDETRIDLNIYDRTHDYPGVRIKRKRVLISPWEDYLIFDQFWTLQLEGDHVFDVRDSTDPALENGLPIRLPYRAEGISASGPGDHQVIDNIVFWNGVMQPDQPITLQIRFSKSAHSPEFTFEQPVQYPVDDLAILATVDTDFNKVPRLDDLTLRAPGFDVSDDPTQAGLPAHTTRDFLVATGQSLESGDSYTFRLEGLPFSRPLGAWIAVIGGILGALFIAFYGRREYMRINESRDDAAMLDALHNRRTDLVDELAALKQQIQETRDEDDLLDLEQEEILIRQRLQLVLRKIEELEVDVPDSQAA